MKNLIWLLPALILAACNSNPYSGKDSNYTTDPNAKRIKPIQAVSPIRAPNLVDAVEGQSTAVHLEGRVLSGQGVFTFQNMPPWIGFAGGTLTIAPPIGAAHQIANGEYTFAIVLTSDLDPAETYPQNMTVIVRPPAPSLAITGLNASTVLREGETFVQNIKVNTPNLPVTISAAGLPEGLQIMRTEDQTVFALTYKAPYTAVTQSNHVLCTSDSQTTEWCNHLTFNIVAVDSTGASNTATASWMIFDVRRDAKVSLVTTPVIYGSVTPPGQRVNQNAPFNARFTVVVEDPNGEAAPSVSLLPSDVGGSLSGDLGGVSAPDEASLPNSMINVKWSGIPQSARGQAQTLTINSCVVGGAAEASRCKNLSVPVQF